MRHTKRIRENESQILQRVTNRKKKVKLDPLLAKKRKKRISKNTAYKKGRQLEYRVVKHFQKLGYYARRNYASKGAEDVNAMKKVVVHDKSGRNGICSLSEVLHIQCKNLKVEKPLNKTEAANLKALAMITGGTPMLAQNINHKLVITEIE